MFASSFITIPSLLFKVAPGDHLIKRRIGAALPLNEQRATSNEQLVRSF
ncbi:MAG: hypothetical protein ACYCUV_10640 [Phycisphaerae bacterium]